MMTDTDSIGQTPRVRLNVILFI